MRNFFRLYFFGALLLAHLAASDALASSTEVVSVNNQGVPVSSDYRLGAIPSISADGRYVAFFSRGNFGPEYPQTGNFDVYVHDRQTGKTELISKSPTGERGNGWSQYPVLSGDGRFVVYYSNASNIFPEAGPGRKLFIHDRTTGVTEQVNMPPPGMYLTGDGSAMFYGPQVAVSYDGRFVAFQAYYPYQMYSSSPFLQGIFLRDRLNGTTEMVSVNENGINLPPGASIMPALSSDGRFIAFVNGSFWNTDGSTLVIRDQLTGTVEQVKCDPVGNMGGPVGRVSMSGDGRYVTFSSRADYLVPGDTNGQIDIFVYDRIDKTFERVNITTDGEQANRESAEPYISADGRFVSFSSLATNLVPDDTNGQYDVFVHDRVTGTTERVSVSSDGGQIDGSAYSPMSADGRFVAFASSLSGYPHLVIYVRDRQSIVANAGNDQVVEQTSPTGAYVTLDGSASKSGCSNAMAYDWTWSGGSANGVNPTVPMPAGITLVTLKVSACGNSATATVKVTVQDTIKPSTTAALSGNKGLNDWFVSNITVSLSAADSGSGVKEVHYSLNGGAETVIVGSSASFALDTDGVHTVTYYAVDHAGNVESARTVTAKIDKTPPEVSLSPSLNIIWPPNHKLVDVVINGSASDALSGVVSVDISVIDEYGIYNMKAPGFGSVIQLEAWRNGNDMDGRQYKITAVVTDNAGNQATSTTQALVPHDMRNK